MSTKTARPGLMGKLLRMNARWFAGALLCTLVCVVTDYLSPLIVAETLDHYLGQADSVLPAFVLRLLPVLNERDYIAQHLYLVGLLIILVNLVNGAASYLKGRLQATAGENVAKYLRDTLYGHIQNLPFSYHAGAETGDLVQRCTSDIDTVRRFLAMQLMQVVNALTMIAVSMTVMLGKNVRLTLISMIMIPGLFLFAFLFFRWVIKAFTASDQAEGRMSTVLQENLTGVRVVRAFGRQQFEIEKFGVKVKDLADKNMTVCRLLAVYWATGDALSMLQMMITLIAGVYAVISGEITLGVMVIFTTYTGKLLFPIRQLGRILSDAGKSRVALGRIGEVLAEPAEPAETDVSRPPLTGDIVFDHVTFGYEPDHPVLKDCSFTIPAGTTAALLGATGSGKSTIAALLQRLYEPQSGQILIGGVPISRVERPYLRSRIGLVLQEPFLYSRTIRENVKIARPEAPDAEVAQAVNDACAAQFIEASEKGWDTLVGERGVTLSGGQKQRLAIARTILKDNDILIFDDSLSAVDTETDAHIRAALRERRKDVTSLIISHRITTLMEADRILVLEDGRIAQEGTHEELIHRPGLYAGIFRIQSAADEESGKEE